MELSFWESKWRKGQTGFHMSQVYPPLITYLPNFNLDEGAKIVIPLCGKSLDINWLANEGFHVTGIELSDIAVAETIRRANDNFTESTKAGFTIYRAKNTGMEIWQGDFMKFKPGWIPKADLVYDKAALIALPPSQRAAYARKITPLLKEKGQIFQQTFEYQQLEMNGPPFSVRNEELMKYYGENFHIALLEQWEASDLRKGFAKRGLQSYLKEKVYRLTPYRN